jgi:hypothetical protein
MPTPTTPADKPCCYVAPDGEILEGVTYHGCAGGAFYRHCLPDGGVQWFTKAYFERTMTEIPDEEPQQPAENWKLRLLVEAQQTAECLNDLNAFMGSDKFPVLPREDKDLLYEQQRAMSTYVQILGKRIERAGAQFTHNR